MRRLQALLFLAVAASSVQCAHADTVLETETAELGHKGEWLISNSVQFERSPEGRAQFTLFQYEYAITDRAEILIEPFFQEWVQPKDGPSYHGVGDLEITPSYMVHPETDSSPAVALALKIKVPTARNRDIGTGKVDYYPYAIIGKHFGNWIMNANLGVDFVGRVPGESMRNQAIYDLALQRDVSDKVTVYGEIFGNSRPSDTEKSTVAGAIAMEYQVTKHFNWFVSVGYDSNNLANIRPGFNIHY